jgi:hypothetical protein
MQQSFVRGCLTNEDLPEGLSKGLQNIFTVVYPEKGVCADPVDKGAILEEGGGKPPNGDKGRQLATDIAGDKT